MLLAMEKTFEQKLEAKPIFPGPLVDTGGCALTCSIWFVRHHQNLTVGSRAIFEKPPKTSTDRTKSSIPCRAQIAPRCTIRIVLLVWTSHVLCIQYYLQKPPTPRPNHESIVSNKESLYLHAHGRPSTKSPWGRLVETLTLWYVEWYFAAQLHLTFAWCHIYQQKMCVFFLNIKSWYLNHDRKWSCALKMILKIIRMTIQKRIKGKGNHEIHYTRTYKRLAHFSEWAKKIKKILAHL